MGYLFFVLYTIIDIEGNGAPYRKESIIEIAIFRYDGHVITDQFISLVNPESEISPFVQKLTGITQKMVKTAPKFHEIAKRIVEITNTEEMTTLLLFILKTCLSMQLYMSQLLFIKFLMLGNLAILETFTQKMPIT